MNKKLRFLSQQIISIIFIPTKRMRSKNMLFLTPMLESNAPYSNLFKNRGWMWLTHALQIAYTDTEKDFLKIVANLKDQKLSNTKVKKSYIFPKKKKLILSRVTWRMRIIVGNPHYIKITSLQEGISSLLHTILHSWGPNFGVFLFYFSFFLSISHEVSQVNHI